MPELPEVETTCRGIEPHVKNYVIKGWDIRQPKLRWLIPVVKLETLVGEAITSVSRRGKYLLLHVKSGTVIIHLGMSGSLRLVTDDSLPDKHDHVDLILEKSKLRLHDPRRFGAVLWQPAGTIHPRLASLGLEPLNDAFNGEYLYQCFRKRKAGIKQLIMNSKIVVGVGNIYANEALFAAGINPQTPASCLSVAKLELLAVKIKQILMQAISQGGTTLKDFVDSQGKAGYFQQSLSVYGRGGKLCHNCKMQLQENRIGQRTTVFCPSCQPLEG